VVSRSRLCTCRAISYNQKGEKEIMAELEIYRKTVQRIARQLEYPPEVMKNLKKAKTETELIRIMAEARRNLK